MKPTLNQLAERHGTDKGMAHHTYTDTYALYLEADRENVQRVLEIGVDGGASLKMWRDYFPFATIYGVDHNPRCAEIPDLGPMVQVLIGDATNSDFWCRFARMWGTDFDLIVDDGAHTTNAIAWTLELTWPLLRSGGLYVIEDLHAVYHKEYQSRLSCDDFWACIMNKIHRELNTWGEPQVGDLTKADPYRLGVEFVHFWRSLAIIKKI